MHIPDGYLSLPTALTSMITTFTIISLAIHKVYRGKSLTHERISLLTALSAGIFVAQMIAWPIPGGTSLHLVGGALAGIVLGPWLGMISMALVLLVQCLLFHDGGITALGANILCMGITAVLSGYTAFKLLKPLVGEFIASVIGGWLSITLAGMMCGVLLSISWGSPLPTYIMAMWHSVLGVLEGLITGSVITYLNVKAPHILGGLK